jgi:hypothetical protein
MNCTKDDSYAVTEIGKITVEDGIVMLDGEICYAATAMRMEYMARPARFPYVSPVKNEVAVGLDTLFTSDEYAAYKELQSDVDRRRSVFRSLFKRLEERP